MMAANGIIEEAGESRWRPTAVSLALGDHDSTAYHALMWWCVLFFFFSLKNPLFSPFFPLSLYSGCFYHLPPLFSLLQKVL